MGCTQSTENVSSPFIQDRPVQIEQTRSHIPQGSNPELLANIGIAAAESLQSSVLMLGNMETNPESLGPEAITVLEWVENGIDSIMELLGKSKAKKIDVQSIKLVQRTPIEQGLAKYSALGQVLVGLSSMALEGLPFGAPVAAALGAVYGRASQAAKNSENCRVLLKLLKSCDAQLARIASQSAVAPEVEAGLLELTHAVLDGARLMHSYAGKGFMMRFIASTSHAQQFQRIDQCVRSAMQTISFATSIELLAGNYQDESTALRSMICQAAGLPEHKAKEALKQLSNNQPELLRSLLEQHGNFSSQVIASELNALGVRVEILEGRMNYYMKSVDENVRGLYLILQMNEKEKELSSAYLADYLRVWWDNNIKRRKDKTEATKFLEGLLNFCEAQGWMPELLSIEDELSSDEDLLAPIAAASRRVSTTYGGKQLAFLDLVVMPLLDRNKDGLVTKDELHWLQMQGELFAARRDVGMPRPNSWMDLLNAIFKGVDANDIALRLELNPEWNEAVAEVVQGLQMSDVIHSYGVEAMLQEFVEGTRDWMYAKVQSWLDDKLNSATSTTSRMFLILAGPGMGKSLFSARMQSKLENLNYSHRNLVQVRHFFKVGEQRSQGKAMVLCLAHQLAEQLPGFAEKLLEVIRVHRNASTLSMTETYEEFLLLPLQELDRQGQKQSHVVVILLDALDEAADGGKDWRAVAALIAKEFVKLPSWVKVILTGRPQAETAFQGWDPVWIRPERAENQKDLHMLLVARLQQRQVVEPQDVLKAASIILEKSAGEFVYAKYAFHELTSRRGKWRPADLEMRLPTGLSGMFRFKLRFLQDSLYQERPELLHLLRHRVLPILVAAKEPLTPIQCAFAAEVEVTQVEELLHLLAPFYFLRLGGVEDGIVRIYPYHKSVRDWLTGEGDQNAAGLQFAVDVHHGHSILGQACFRCLRQEASVISPQGAISSGEGASMLMYSLRYAIAHLGDSGVSAALDELSLDFQGLWQRAYAAGFGPEVLKDLTSPGLHASAVVKDTVRWLRIVNNYLIERPLAALQLACDAPHSTIIAQHAARLPNKPKAVLLTKEQGWTSCLSTLLGHRNIITSMALTPDGQTIVSSSDDHTVRIWDLSSGQLLGMLENDEAVVSVVVSPDSKICVTGSTSSTCKIWNLESGQLLRTLGDAGAAHSGVVRSVAISPDGKNIASGSQDGTIKVWSLETGQLKITVDSETDDVNSLTISPDGSTLIAACDDLSLLVLDMGPEGIKETRRLEGHEGVVLCTAVSSDGRICASGSMDETVRIWELGTGELIGTLEGHSNAVACISILALSEKNVIISGSWDHTIRLWEVSSGKCEASLEGHSGRVSGLAVCPDGLTLCSASWDRSIRVWDLRSEQVKTTLEGQHTGSVENVAVSVDGTICISRSLDKTAKIWDLVTGKLHITLHGHTDLVSSVAISPDKSVCITISPWDTDAVRVWNVSSGMQTAAYKGGSEEASMEKARAQEWVAAADKAFAPASSHLCVDGSNSMISLGKPGDDIYIIPPIRPKKFQKLMYEHLSRTVSFFAEHGTFVRYQLQQDA